MSALAANTGLNGSILIVKTSSLGDVVHMMPALADVRRAHPQAHIAWLVDEMYAPLVRMVPAVDEVVEVSWRRWRRGLHAAGAWRELHRFGVRLRRRRYDVIVDTQGLVHSGMMARLARGVRHGYDAKSAREPLAATLYDVCHDVSRTLPAVVRNRRLAGLALGHAVPEELHYGLKPAWQLPTRGTPYALLVHATAQPRKAWPEAAWCRLGERLAERGIRAVIPAGSEAERARSVAIAEAVPHALALPIHSLERTVDLIMGASLVVGVDTGLVHLAAALGVPTVAVFVASDPALTAPIGQGPIAVAGSKDRPAAEDEVMAAVEGLLAAPISTSPVKLGHDGAKHLVDRDGPYGAPGRVGARRPGGRNP